MKDKILLAGGDIGDRQEAGSSGRPIHALADQIRSLVASELGADAALLLAEPVVDPLGRRIDWYVEAEAEPVAYADLPPPRQRLLVDTLNGRLAAMGELADRFKRADDPARAQMGGVLSQALGRPGAANLYEVDGQPVMAFWGFFQEDPLPPPPAPPSSVAGVAADDAAAFAAQGGGGQPPAPTSSTAVGPMGEVGPMRFVVIGGPVFLAGLAVGLGVLALAVGLKLGGVLPPRLTAPTLTVAAADASPELAIQAAKSEEAELRARLAEATQELAQRQTACVAGPLSSEVVPHPPSGGAVPLGPELQVPTDAAANHDLGFLAGRWVSVTGLRNKESQRPIEVEYRFDQNGKGEVLVHEQGGPECRGEVQAAFAAADTLVIDQGQGPVCDDGSSFSRSRVVCGIDAGGKAKCHGEHDSGSSFDMALHRG